jgi:uncharacterized phage protein (TIGR02216 family)
MLRTAVALGIQPEAFWRLSLKEWRMLTERAGEPTLGRDGLEALMARWPDGAWGESPSTASRSPSPSLRDGEET